MEEGEKEDDAEEDERNLRGVQTKERRVARSQEGKKDKERRQGASQSQKHYWQAQAPQVNLPAQGQQSWFLTRAGEEAGRAIAGLGTEARGEGYSVVCSNVKGSCRRA